MISFCFFHSKDCKRLVILTLHGSPIRVDFENTFFLQLPQPHHSVSGVTNNILVEMNAVL